MTDLQDLYNTKRILENKIDDYFGNGQIHTGDRGYQDLLNDLDNNEEEIKEIETKNRKMSEYTAEDFVSFIETGRRDKISQDGLEMIAKRFRELEANEEKPGRKIWLEDAILEHITNNPKKDSVGICVHFKLRADITMASLHQLVEDGKVQRKHLWELNHGYIKC